MLRQVGVEPPKWHDVGPLLKEYRMRFPEQIAAQVERLADISGWLRKEREFSFYGDIDFIRLKSIRKRMRCELLRTPILWSPWLSL